MKPIQVASRRAGSSRKDRIGKIIWEVRDAKLGVSAYTRFRRYRHRHGFDRRKNPGAALAPIPSENGDSMLSPESSD
jgi:hypothetical protein